MTLRERVHATLTDANKPVTADTVASQAHCGIPTARRHLNALIHHGYARIAEVDKDGRFTYAARTPTSNIQTPDRLSEPVRHQLGQAIERHPEFAAFLAGREAHQIDGRGWISNRPDPTYEDALP